MNVTIYNSDNTALVTVTALEDSIISNEIRGDHILSLSFSSPEFIDIQEGAYVIVNGVTFTLLSQNKIEMTHTRSYEYTVIFESGPAFLSSIVMRNPADGQLSFPYTASAEDHLSLIIANLNRYDSTDEWQIGECQTDGGEKFLQYEYVSCRSALDSIADMFGTEWEISGHTISLHKVEYNLDSPLDLQYGKGFGLRPGIVREVVDRPMTRIYTQGGSKNIDASKYGSAILLLPKSKTFRYDGNKFEDEDGFDASKARTYSTDSEGTYISSTKNASKVVNEGVIDCTDIYPNKIYNVIDVIDSGSNPREIILDIEEGLDYSQYQILGELPTITFQSGELTGKTFEIRRNQDGSVMMRKSYSDNGAFVGWIVTLSGLYDGGRWIPDSQSGLVPQKGDTCRIFGTRMPDQYVCDDENKSGASWDMLRRGIMYLYEYEDYIYSLKIEIDPIWARQNWSTISQKFILGGYVKYTNDGWASNGVMMRIQSIRLGVVNPYSIEINLGNGIVGGGVLKGLSDQISRQSGSISEQQTSQKSIEYNISNMGSDFVTLSTDQTIKGKKTFANDVIFGGAVSEGVYGKLLIPSTAGPGIYGLLVSDEPVQGEVPSGSGGLDKAELWLELGGSTDNPVIGKNHLPGDTVYTDDLAGYALKSELPDLTPYATQEWVTGQGYATQTWVQGLGYLTATDADERYVNITGDTMTGPLHGTDIELSGHIAASVLYVPYSGGNKIYSLSVSDTPVQGEAPSGSGGLDSAALWEELGGNATDKVIGLSRIPDIPVDMVSGLLGGDSRILPSLLPDWLMGQLLYGGTVDGSSVATVSAAFKDRYGTGGDTVTLNASNASQYEGVYFIASADASSGVVQSLGVRTGDWVVSNGLAWTKIDNTDSVSSVAGLTGVISKAALQTALSDSTHRFVTDAQTALWDGKWAWNEEDIKAVKVNAAVLADKAKALNAARSLWGQSFDGTGNVSGNMTGVGGITMSGSIAGAVNADFSGYLSAGTLYVPYSGGSKVYSLKVSDAPVSGEAPSGGGGMDTNALWLELGGSTDDKVIAKSHLPEDTVYEGDLAGYALKSEIPSLAGYATQSWVQQQGYLTSVSLATISDLHSSWDAVLKVEPTKYVTRWPTASEVGALTQTSADSRYAIQANDNNLISHSNEFNVIPAGFSNVVWFNFRAKGGTGRISQYIFGRGSAVGGEYAELLGSNFIADDGAGFVKRMHADTSNFETGPVWDNAAGTSHLAAIGYWNTPQKVFINPCYNEVTDAWMDAVGKHNFVVGKNFLTYNTYPILRSDNIGSYALTPSNYASHLDSRYVNVSGDTMTGTLTVDVTGTGNALDLVSDNTTETYLRVFMGASYKAAIGYHSTHGAYLYNRFTASYLGLRDNGLAYRGGYVVWDAGNDGSGSGLDADLLDGYQASSFLLKSGGTMTGNLTLKSMGGTWLDGKTQAPIMTNGASSTNGNLYHPVIWGKTDAGDVWNLGHGASDQVGFFGFYSERTVNGTDWAHYIKVSDGTVHFNKTVYGTTFSGALSGNATSATKLQTSRTLWGQSFDGTQNVSGDMTGVGNFTGVGQFKYGASDESNATYGKYHRLNLGYHNIDHTDFYEQVFNFYSNGGGTTWAKIGSTNYFNGNVGIGTASPAYKLDVSGKIRATAGITIGSTDDYGWYISGDNRITAGGGTARGVNVGNLLVSNAWADYTKVPSNGIYCKGSILIGGTITGEQNVIAYSSSSRALKDIVWHSSYSEKLQSLGRVVDYRYNDILKRDKEIHTGLIYESVKPVIPSMCYMYEGYGALNYLSPDYINLIAGAVQEHTSELTTLRNKVRALEDEISRLRRGLAA